MNVYTIYTRPLSVQAQYSRKCPIISSSCYNSSLVTWTVVCLTAAKSKPLIFPVSGFALSNESESESHCDWRSVSLSVLVSSPVRGSWPDISYFLTISVLSLGVAPSLTRGWVCLLSTELKVTLRLTVGQSVLRTFAFSWFCKGSCSSLYSFGTDRTENTVSNSSIVACVSCGHYTATAVVYTAIT
jgi:hypothetical protein